MAGKAIAREHDFETHKSGCNKCALVDVGKPSTLVQCCWVGAPLLRDYLNALSAPAVRKQNAALKRQFTQDADGKNYSATKQKLREVMKYK